MTDASVGVMVKIQFTKSGAIHIGKAVPSSKDTFVNVPEVLHEPTVHALMAGLELQALADMDGYEIATYKELPRTAFSIEVTPSSHGYRLQSQDAG